MNEVQMKNLIRNDFLTLIMKAIETEKETDALLVSANEIAVPCLDSEGNETWAVIKVSIPRGTRNGKGGYNAYDGYEEAKIFAQECKYKAEEKAAKEAEKQKKIAADEKKRAEKKALAEANKGLKELRKIKDTPQA